MRKQSLYFRATLLRFSLIILLILCCGCCCCCVEGLEDDDMFLLGGGANTLPLNNDLQQPISIIEQQITQSSSSLSLSSTAGQGFAIPGTTQTLSGYDTEYGTDAICWKSKGSTALSTTDSIAFPNQLLEDYALTGRVDLLESCPGRNALTGSPPEELQVYGERLRTGREYNYSVMLQLDLSSMVQEILQYDDETTNVTTTSTTTTTTTKDKDHLDDDMFMITADEGEGWIAVQVVLCELGRSGFCSPFIHEQSNARLASLGITQTPGFGERHGNSHVHSKYSKVQIPTTSSPSTSMNDTDVVQIPVQVTAKINEPGTFFVVAAVQLFLKQRNNNNNENDDDNNNNHVVYRYDMANALSPPYKYIQYQDPAEILTVSDPVRIVTFVLIGCASSILLFLLLFTVYHRDHQVFKLTQGYFLIGFLLAALTASMSSFLLDPRNDTYCRSGSFLTVTALHYMYAVNIGRLWRINAVISPLLAQSLRAASAQGTSSSASSSASCCCGWDRINAYCMQGVDRMCHAILSLCGKQQQQQQRTNDGSQDSSAAAAYNNNNNNHRQGPGRNLRKQVTCRQLAMVIAFFTLPQVIIQVLAFILQTPYADIEMNSDESKGRTICSTGVDILHDLHMYGIYLFMLVLILLLIMALATRKLPSLLNETSIILESTIASVGLLILGVGVIAITDSPTAPPSLRYLVMVLVTNSFALDSSIRIILPKLRMIWRGETVLVSKLVSDSVSVRTSAASTTTSRRGGGGGGSPSSILQNVSGFSIPDSVNIGVGGVGGNNNNGGSEAAASSGNNNNNNSNNHHGGPPRRALTITSELTDASESEGYNLNFQHQDSFGDGLLLSSQQQQQSQSPVVAAVAAPAANRKNRVSFSAGAIANNNNNNNNERRKKPIKISPTISPDRDFLLKMVAVQENLSKLTSRIMSGMVVSEAEWAQARNMSKDLGQTFENDVEFAWERISLIQSDSANGLTTAEEDKKQRKLSMLAEQPGEVDVENGSGLDESHLARVSDELDVIVQVQKDLELKDTENESGSSRELLDI